MSRGKKGSRPLAKWTARRLVGLGSAPETNGQTLAMIVAELKHRVRVPVETKQRIRARLFPPGTDPSGMVPCPVCSCEVRGRNLERHVQRSHVDPPARRRRRRRPTRQKGRGGRGPIFVQGSAPGLGRRR